ncbi:hypothetical protein AAFF_G00281840 [Aldrovandia affinis]|uniref:Uncharacterized protein n=1 Tax=Aldrovandia affinis TaxID=143900 RepID=A0AAD7RA06_9TELE|nr:hypothetical protein AAFF_G00281840 [Aldrovandia affinis]
MVSSSFSSSFKSPHPHVLVLLLLALSGPLQATASASQSDHQMLNDLLASRIASLRPAPPKVREGPGERPAPPSRNSLLRELGAEDPPTPRPDSPAHSPAHSPALPHLLLSFLGQQTRFKGRTRKRREPRPDDARISGTATGLGC